MTSDFAEFQASDRRQFLNPTADVFRFRVVLEHVEPAVWRVFDIPADARLPVLSDTLLAAMGWMDVHLHEFTVGRMRISPAAGDEDPYRIIDESSVFIAALFHDRGDSCGYQYDFGDWWEHTVQMVDFFPRVPGAKYPLLVDGARACPPEDFGGPHFYNELSQSGKTLPGFDPAAFDFDAASDRVRKVKLSPAPRPRKPARAPAQKAGHDKRVYEFRVTLAGAEPAPWRLVAISADSTLPELHRTIEGAFGERDTSDYRIAIGAATYEGGKGMRTPLRRVLDVGTAFECHDAVRNRQYVAEVVRSYGVPSRRHHPKVLDGAGLPADSFYKDFDPQSATWIAQFACRGY